MTLVGVAAHARRDELCPHVNTTAFHSRQQTHATNSTGKSMRATQLFQLYCTEIGQVWAVVCDNYSVALHWTWIEHGVHYLLLLYGWL
jgi:hypothetical protein